MKKLFRSDLPIKHVTLSDISDILKEDGFIIALLTDHDMKVMKDGKEYYLLNNKNYVSIFDVVEITENHSIMNVTFGLKDINSICVNKHGELVSVCSSRTMHGEDMIFDKVYQTSDDPNIMSDHVLSFADLQDDDL